MNQVFQTILAGTLVFVLGQIIQNFILKPIQDFRRTLLDISHKVKFHSNIITRSETRKDYIDWASGDMRDLSCNLESKYLLVPFNSVFSLLGILPRKEDINKASRLLMSLSNAGGKKGYEERNDKAIKRLKKVLQINLG